MDNGKLPRVSRSYPDYECAKVCLGDSGARSSPSLDVLLVSFFGEFDDTCWLTNHETFLCIELHVTNIFLNGVMYKLMI